MGILRGKLSGTAALGGLGGVYTSSPMSWLRSWSVLLTAFHRAVTLSMSRTNRITPNYFIGYRLNCPEFQSKVGMIQQYIIDTYPPMKSMLTSVKKLHITGFVINLKEEHLGLVNAALNEIRSECLITLPVLSFTKFGKFSNRVLYIEPHDDDGIDFIRNMNELIYYKLMSIEALNGTENGLQNIDLQQWKAHVTIAKVKPMRNKNMKSKLLVSEDDLHLLEEQLGCWSTPLLSIDLLSMTEVDEQGYYRSYCRIDASSLDDSIEVAR